MNGALYLNNAVISAHRKKRMIANAADTRNKILQSMKNIYYSLFLLVFFLDHPAAWSSDLDKEKRWSEEIIDSLMVGESCELAAGNTKFLGIFTEASDGPGERAVILLHGMGAHPNWPEVIYPLRSELPKHHWATLSIQMPVLANNVPLKSYAPLFDEVGTRIDAAIAYLKEKGYTKTVLLGHSLGASMGAYYLTRSKPGDLIGFVAIGLSVIDIDEKMNAARALEKIAIPVLDIYGSRDLNGVLNTAQQRAKAAIKAGNKHYRQTEIEGAGHFFAESEDILIRRVYGWLKRNFGPKDRR